MSTTAVAAYGYDTAGRRTEGRLSGITWNGLGEASTVKTPSLSLDLVYSPDGDLVENTGPYGGRYVGNWVKMSETDSSTWHARIMVGGSVVAVIASDAGTVSTRYLLQNALGSTVEVTDDKGNSITRIMYDVWGNLVSPVDGKTPVGPNTIAALTTVNFNGEELIAGADLIQMGARLYDPSTGMFMSPDPTNSKMYDSRSWNQFAYAYDNPMRYIDPSGFANADAGGLTPSLTDGGNICDSRVDNCWMDNAYVSQWECDWGFACSGTTQPTASPSEYSISTPKNGGGTTPTGNQKDANENAGGTVATSGKKAKVYKPMKFDLSGIKLLMILEGKRLGAYQDSAKHGTIGYGHKILPGEKFPKKLTNQEALALLRKDLKRFVGAVNNSLEKIGVTVTQNQFDALVIMAFNAGPASVRPKGEMMQAIKNGQVTPENFTAYDHKSVMRGKKRVLVFSRGLFNRDLDEFIRYDWQEF